MDNATNTTAKYLDPQVLATMSGLELRARLVVEGFFAGMHHSPHRGVSIEFADHRCYTQGDDLKHIDWKVFGRTDKYYIKEYEQETNLELLLLIDASESMAFSSNPKGMTKYEYACTAAASIAHLALGQRDSVGLAIFDEHLTEFIKPSNHRLQWMTIADALSKGIGTGQSDLGKVFADLGERLSHRTLILIISDLFDDPVSIIKGLKNLRYRRHEPIVWQVWDEAELSLPFRGPTLFQGMEMSGELLADPYALRDGYLAEVSKFLTEIRTACGRSKIDYAMFTSAQSLGVVLSNYLASRSVQLRHRSSRVRRT